MKNIPINKCGWALGVLLAATSAFAQKEQWLQYHTTREGRSYQYIDLTTNPPPDVKLPKLNAPPYFARWITPLDPAGGRWMCLDRSRKTGPYDRLYLDTKGDGNLADKAAMATLRTDQYSAVFEPAKLVFKSDDGPLTYHLLLRFMKYDNDPARLLASSGCYYAGEVDLGGKKRRVELTDGNVNGTFNDCGATTRDSDRIEVQGEKDGDRYLGRMIEVDKVFYRIEVARDGAFLKLEKAENVVLGKVRVPETISSFVAFGENGHFSRKPVKGELTLPAGAYTVEQWTINRKDNQGATWELLGYREKKSCAFEVADAGSANVQIGEPVRMELTAKEGTNRVDFNLSFVAGHGESVQILKGNQRPPGPKLFLASLDGTYHSTNTFEFG